MNQESIGAFISEMRKEQGMTQEQLTEKLGVQVSELLILIGIIMSITLTKVLATTTFEMIITLVCGWFVWGFGLMLRGEIEKSNSETREKLSEGQEVLKPSIISL